MSCVVALRLDEIFNALLVVSPLERVCCFGFQEPFRAHAQRFCQEKLNPFRLFVLFDSDISE